MNPADYIDRLVLYMGRNSYFGKNFRISIAEFDRLCGKETMRFFSTYLKDKGFIDDLSFGAGMGGNLTVDGWQEFDRLSKGGATGTTAFLAHKFNDPQIGRTMAKFAEVCEKSGYRAVDLETHTQAGRISDRIELEIKLSRFIIADLTHANNGAYWEAGFAAGLGRKVIYTCRADLFEEAGTHFDVNHHTTIPWDPDDLSGAMERLDACIRNTFEDGR